MLQVQYNANLREDQELRTTLGSVFFGQTFADPIMFLAITPLHGIVLTPT